MVFTLEMSLASMFLCLSTLDLNTLSRNGSISALVHHCISEVSRCVDHGSTHLRGFSVC
jgi:hypothetical protein